MRSVTGYSPHGHVQHRCTKSCFHKRDVISEALKCLKTYQYCGRSRAAWVKKAEEADMLQQKNASDRRYRQAERDDG